MGYRVSFFNIQIYAFFLARVCVPIRNPLWPNLDRYLGLHNNVERAVAS